MAKISEEEKFVNALNKLLANYGVDDEELRTEFITDFKNEVDNAVDGEEEIDTEKEVDETKEQEPIETETNENETVEEEPTEDKQEPEIELDPTQDEQEKVEESEVDGTVEQEPKIDYKQVYEEQKNTIEGLVARIETLENIVSKLGVPEKDETFGASPVAENQPSDTNNAFDRYINARKGQ